MCLCVDIRASKDCKYTLDYYKEKNQKILVYKIVKKSFTKDVYLSPFQSNYIYLNKELVADGEPHQFNIDKGAIHCIRTLDEAIRYKNFFRYPEQYTILECEVQAEDFLGKGYSKICKTEDYDELKFCTDESVAFKKILPVREVK